MNVERERAGETEILGVSSPFVHVISLTTWLGIEAGSPRLEAGN
jgi:hypothetical protein